MHGVLRGQHVGDVAPALPYLARQRLHVGVRGVAPRGLHRRVLEQLSFMRGGQRGVLAQLLSERLKILLRSAFQGHLSGQLFGRRLGFGGHRVLQLQQLHIPVAG